jgi:hypothetical protein
MAALRQAVGLAKTGVRVDIVGQGTLPTRSRGDPISLWDVELGKTIVSKSRAGFYFKVLAFAVMAGIRGAGVVRKHADIQVIHCHHSSTVITVRLLAPRRPVVLTIPDPPFRKSDPAVSVFEQLVRIVNNLLLERWGVAWADHVVAVSPEIARRLADWGVEPSKLSEILPISADMVEPLDDAVATRLVKGVGVSRPFILCVGDLMGRKRTDMLVESMPGVSSTTSLVIVGRGPLRRSVVHEITQRGLEERVVLLDYADRETLAALQQTAEASVLVSEREGLPAVLLESVRAGTPALYCTTSPVSLPSTGQYLRHVVTASPATIAREINAILAAQSDPAWDRRKVREWAQHAFPDNDATIRRLEHLYLQLVEGTFAQSPQWMTSDGSPTKLRPGT